MSNNPKSRPPNIIRHYLQISSIATQVELLCPTCKLAPLVTRLGRSLLAKPASTSCLSNVKKCQGEDRKGSKRIEKPGTVVQSVFNRKWSDNDQIDQIDQVTICICRPSLESHTEVGTHDVSWRHVSACFSMVLRWHGIIWRWLHGSVASGYSSHYIIHHLTHFQNDYDQCVLPAFPKNKHVLHHVPEIVQIQTQETLETEIAVNHNPALIKTSIFKRKSRTYLPWCRLRTNTYMILHDDNNRD